MVFDPKLLAQKYQNLQDDGFKEHSLIDDKSLQTGDRIDERD